MNEGVVNFLRAYARVVEREQAERKRAISAGENPNVYGENGPEEVESARALIGLPIGLDT